MFKNNRKTIGVFISQIGSEYQYKLSKGIAQRAKELGYNIAFFTNNGGYGQDSYDVGEKLILELPCYDRFDGIIVALDTIAIKGMEDMLKQMISKYSSCPVVSVRQYEEAYCNILVDNDSILEGIIEHFITKHKFTKINFVTGRMDLLDAKQRLGTYKRIMEKHGLPVEESRIFYGDYWKEQPRKAVKVFFDGVRREDWPEAIVCSNDYMAIAITDELERNGIRVPEDVCISGCDNIEGAISNIPAITTVEISFSQMGMLAVEKIDEICKGHKVEKNSMTSVTTYFRESCGCNSNSDDASLRRKNVNLINKMTEKNEDIAYMSTDVARVVMAASLPMLVRYYINLIDDYQEFYLCLNHDWLEEDVNKKKDISIYSDQMVLEAGVIRGDFLRGAVFSRKDMLPDIAIKDEPMCYYFTPLHYQNRSFGYTAISFRHNSTLGLIFQSWLINMSNALENVRLYTERNRLYKRLENMYIRDELTGLYNRRGLSQLWESFKIQCREENMRIMVICADLDDLKIINDSYGHSSGDIAIKRITKAMLNVSHNDAIIARCGGDEFTIVDKVAEEIDMHKYMDQIQKELAKLNEEATTEFQVFVSLGGYITLPTEEVKLEDCMNASDSRMYEQKYRKKAFRYRIINQ